MLLRFKLHYPMNVKPIYNNLRNRDTTFIDNKFFNLFTNKNTFMFRRQHHQHFRKILPLRTRVGNTTIR